MSRHMFLRDASRSVVDKAPSQRFFMDPFQTDFLSVFFRPQAVAVIGATERQGSVGSTLTRNLIVNSFGGPVFPVSHSRNSVHGVKAYKTIADIPDPVDLAVIVTPSRTVPGVVEECGRANVKGVIVVSAGFREIGEEGNKLEMRIVEIAKQYGMRIIGPNCLGVMCPPHGLNATFAADMAKSGSVALISQSGAMCTSILDWSLKNDFGFSAFISIGSQADVGWGDLIQFLGNDPATTAILIYMETVGDARGFISAARKVALNKPIIVIKAGRSEEAAKAAASHTGSLSGSDDVLDAAFERCGVLRVRSIEELFLSADVLAKQPLPGGRHLCIVTNAGGPGVLTTDELVAGHGKLSVLSQETMKALNDLLPEHWSHANPVDILGDARPEVYRKTVEIVAKDDNVDAVLVVLTPQAMSNPTETAKHIVACMPDLDVPIYTSWMGESAVQAGRDIMTANGCPSFDFPDTATRVFNLLWKYRDGLTSLYECLGPSTGLNYDRQRARSIINKVRATGRLIMTETESKEVLASYGIDIPQCIEATSEDEAVAAAEKIGYPVVLKITSYIITHKSDVGGVKLNLRNANDVKNAYQDIKTKVIGLKGAEAFIGVSVHPFVKLKGYECLLGSSTDSQFGPVAVFGTGGTLVEVHRDSRLGLPPLTRHLARSTINKTRIYKALKGFRGEQPVDMFKLENTLMALSHLVVDNGPIVECDVNPLLVSADSITALDARVVLSPPEAPVIPPAIRPYPHEYIKEFNTSRGYRVRFRPIRPEDEEAMIRFHSMLSSDTIQNRFYRQVDLAVRTEHLRLITTCFADFARDMPLVAVLLDDNTGQESQIIADARVVPVGVVGSTAGYISIMIADKYQSQGIGTIMLSHLVDVVRRDGMFDKLIGWVLSDNKPFQKLLKSLGFAITSVTVPTHESDTLDFTSVAMTQVVGARRPRVRTSDVQTLDMAMAVLQIERE